MCQPVPNSEWYKFFLYTPKKFLTVYLFFVIILPNLQKFLDFFLHFFFYYFSFNLRKIIKFSLILFTSNSLCSADLLGNQRTITVTMEEEEGKKFF